MKSIPEQQRDRESLVHFFSQIAQTKLEDLTRLNLGEINFALAEPLFSQMKSFCSAASKYQWDNFPVSLVLDNPPPGGGQPLGSDLTNLGNIINQIRTFSVLAPNPMEQRNRLLAQLESFWARAYSGLAPMIAYQTATDTSLKTMVESEIAAMRLTMTNELNKVHSMVASDIEKARSNLASANQEFETAKVNLKQQQEDVSRVLQSVQAAAKEVGATQEAIHFDRLARSYFWVSMIWLLFAALFGTGAFVYAVFHLPNVAAPDLPTFAKLIVPRLIVVSLLLTGLFFCLRNFSAVSHNQVVNRHRQTALSTFKTFVSSTNDNHVKNAVLLQATRAIFLPQPSGYLKGETESPQISQITEVVKEMAGTGVKPG